MSHTEIVRAHDQFAARKRGIARAAMQGISGEVTEVFADVTIPPDKQGRLWRVEIEPETPADEGRASE